MARKHAKIAVISCTHAPFVPHATHEWVLEQLSSIDGLTHFVHLGDLFEGGAASVHPNEYTHTLEDEFASGASFLKSIRSCVPLTTRLVCCIGNHDDNILTADPRRIDKSLRALADWRKHPEHSKEFDLWHWVPYEKSARGVYRVGQIHLFHGFDAGMNSDEIEGLQMVGMCGWTPYSLSVRGHTHRPVKPTRARRSARCLLPYWHMNVGTCGPRKPWFMKRKDTSQWNAGMAVIEATWDKPSKISGKSWTAELREMPT